MKLRTVVPLLLLAAGLTLSACGSAPVAGTPSISAAAVTAAPAASSPAAPATPASASPVAAPAPVRIHAVAGLGDVMVGADGSTLYGFTDDRNGASTCAGPCAAAWPPLIVPGGLPAGLDPAVFSVIERSDGSSQLKAGKWPLYSYVGDARPGEANGQGSADKWYVLTAAGSLVKPAAAPSTSTPTTVSSAAPNSDPPRPAAKPPVRSGTGTDLGEILVGANGLTLYGFTDDKDGTSTCADACAAAWPPLTVSGALPAGLDPTLFSVIDRADGTRQLKAGKWPLYYFAGDGEPGDANGQGSKNKWFAVTKAGKLVKPAAAQKPAPKPTVDPYAPVGDNAVNLADVGNLGEVMVGATGLTLYAFTDDPEKQSSCFDACAKAWPPVIVKDTFTVPEQYQGLGVDTFERPDGTRQLVMGKWALYYYAGDQKPGDANGQGANDKWFAVDAACTLVKTPVS